MATFTAGTAPSVNFNSMFPGVFSQPFVVAETEPGRFSIQYLSGANVVRFVSDGSAFTYNADDPISGTFNEIVLEDVNGTELGRWTGLAPTALTLFNSANLDELLLAGSDTLLGNSEGDQLYGGGGADVINGAGSDDDLIGGLGKDVLTGGLGADSFEFVLAAETRKGAANRDVIVDFKHDDTIDLSAIDANSKKAGVQHFDFIGKQHFHHKAGELHFVKKEGFLLVEGDTNGNGKADFQIEVHGVNKLFLDDFTLIPN